jgi:hypothetical protein
MYTIYFLRVPAQLRAIIKQKVKFFPALAKKA